MIAICLEEDFAYVDTPRERWLAPQGSIINEALEAVQIYCHFSPRYARSVCTAIERHIDQRPALAFVQPLARVERAIP